MLSVVFVSALCLLACGDQTATSSSTETSVDTSIGTSSSAAADVTTSTIPPTTTAESEPMPTEPTAEPEPVCRRLADFESPAENERWSVVNDDVMGGRSIGELSFQDSLLVFEGEINTNGGGFSSIRLPLDADDLTAYERVMFRARPDARSYMVTFDDNLATRNRRVSHRAPIPFDRPGQWQTVSVSFTDLFPAIFGNPIDDLPFQKDLATRMGLMISDGIDDGFRLEVDWIDVCPPT